MDKYKTKFQNRESIYLIYGIILFPVSTLLGPPGLLPWYSTHTNTYLTLIRYIYPLYIDGVAISRI